MSLTSVNYILFLLASVTLFYLVPARFKSHIIFLVSVTFYLFFSPGKLLILMAYIWVIYILAAVGHKHSKYAVFFTAVGIIGSVALLIFFRAFTALKQGDLTPLGLSYCILQSISYLRQVYSREIPPVESPVDLFAFLLFFPKIMAGPVENPRKFLSDLEVASYSKLNIYKGLPLIAVGIAKKLAVAEVLTPAVSVIFDGPAAHNGLASLLGVIFYSFVILFDFSGYTDIALGSALLFGIPLTENFKNPYLAVGMIDFWKRWHISLTSWLRTNIYFSLGGNRVSRKERYLNVLTIFMISGIWHGTTLSYLVWGMYHGLLQMAELFFLEKTGIKTSGKKAPALIRPLLIIMTFILATIGWVLFRASNLENAFAIIAGIFAPWSSFTLALKSLGITLFALIFAIASIIVTTIFKDILVKKELSLFSSSVISALAILLALAGVILLGSGSSSSFIYFNF